MGISFKSSKNQIKISVVLTAAASGEKIYIYFKKIEMVYISLYSSLVNKYGLK